MAELPVLEQLHRAFETDGFHLIGVNVDAISSEDLQIILDKHIVIYTIVRDRTAPVARIFAWRSGVPQSLLIDAEGRIALYRSGGIHPSDVAAHAALADTIRSLLSSAGQGQQFSRVR